MMGQGGERNGGNAGPRVVVDTVVGAVWYACCLSKLMPCRTCCCEFNRLRVACFWVSGKQATMQQAQALEDTLLHFYIYTLAL